MKRSQPLQRRTALRSTTALRRTPMRRQPTPDPIGQATRTALAARSGGRCEIAAMDCTGTATDAHHRLRRRDGDHRLVNLLHCCRRCHSLAHGFPALARLAGWIVPTWQRPEDVPVRLRGVWVLLEERAA